MPTAVLYLGVMQQTSRVLLTFLWGANMPTTAQCHHRKLVCWFVSDRQTDRQTVRLADHMSLWCLLWCSLLTLLRRERCTWMHRSSSVRDGMSFVLSAFKRHTDTFQGLFDSVSTLSAALPLIYNYVTDKNRRMTNFLWDAYASFICNFKLHTLVDFLKCSAVMLVEVTFATC